MIILISGDGANCRPTFYNSLDLLYVTTNIFVPVLVVLCVVHKSYNAALYGYIFHLSSVKRVLTCLSCVLITYLVLNY